MLIWEARMTNGPCSGSWNVDLRHHHHLHPPSLTPCSRNHLCPYQKPVKVTTNCLHIKCTNITANRTLSWYQWICDDFKSPTARQISIIKINTQVSHPIVYVNCQKVSGFGPVSYWLCANWVMWKSVRLQNFKNHPNSLMFICMWGMRMLSSIVISMWR